MLGALVCATFLVIDNPSKAIAAEAAKIGAPQRPAPARSQTLPEESAIVLKSGITAFRK